MNAHITLLETSSPVERGPTLSQIVRRALDRALVGATNLAPEVLAIPGMSGRKYRCFINNLVAELPAPRYLEVGTWSGSTLCSAISGNNISAVAIDNWSEYEGPFGRFFNNLAQFKGAARVSFLEQDFRRVDYASLGRVFGPFGAYLYDGPHGFEDQYDGIMIVQPALERCYVQIVDDWNYPQVRGGTLKAIADLGLHVEFMAEIRTTLNDQHTPPPMGAASDWHNGYCISVLRSLA